MRKTLIALFVMHCLLACAHSPKTAPQVAGKASADTVKQEQTDQEEDSVTADVSLEDGELILVMTHPDYEYELVMKFVEVEAGTFMMGATPEMQNPSEQEKPAHKVTLTKNYYIATTEVTQRVWNALMETNPSEFKDRGLSDYGPVERVTWDDAQEFIRRLNALTGKQFRLPTEAEWEFAARGGNKSKHYQYSGSNDVDEVAWYDWGEDNYDGTYRAFESVGTKKPNELGIYDMSGNVSEWCQDWFGPYSSEPQVDPQGPATGEYRVYRSGMRISDRDGGYQSIGGADAAGMGFRLAITK